MAEPAKPVDPAVRIAVTTPFMLGESPFWHPDDLALWFVDIVGHALVRFDPSTGTTRRLAFDTEVACCAPMLSGDLIVGMRDGLWRVDPASGARTRLAPPPYDPAGERFNDGKCDPVGRFWVGTMHEGGEPLGTLNVWTRGRLEHESGGVATLNGLGWSPDGRTMYWSDTGVGTVFRADYDPGAGRLGPQTVFARFPDRAEGQALATYGGRPDGAAVDVDGCYWAAMYEGQRIVRLSPEGDLLREVILPARCPTMPCFGGPDLKTLYVTSAREGRPDDELVDLPYSGCVFALEVDVPGLPVNFSR